MMGMRVVVKERGGERGGEDRGMGLNWSLNWSTSMIKKKKKKKNMKRSMKSKTSGRMSEERIIHLTLNHPWLLLYPVHSTPQLPLQLLVTSIVVVDNHVNKHNQLLPQSLLPLPHYESASGV
jgi:hypothetical protein